MKRAIAVCGLAWLCSINLLPAAAAEATGQQRAQAAGRAILGTAAPRRAVTTIDGDVIVTSGEPIVQFEEKRGSGKKS